jgi:putative aminopeptidase FrvX
VDTAGIAVPVRYIHTPAETAAKSDILLARDLLIRFLEADADQLADREPRGGSGNE